MFLYINIYRNIQNNLIIKMLIDEYLEYQLKFQEKYGEETLVLMQVGSFFEFYGVDNAEEKIGNLQFITELLNIQMTRRNKAILENSRSNCLMAGFPVHALKKFIPLLLNNNYTIILIEQVTEPPNPKREITQIYSPGTYIEEINKSDPNYIVSIYLTEHRCHKTGSAIYQTGMSAIDLSTGQNLIYQGSVNSYDKNAMFEDIYRFIEANNPKEMIFYSSDFTDIKAIRQVFNSTNRILHMHNGPPDKRFYQLSYQNAFLDKVFPNHGLLTPIEYLDFERRHEALISYLILLDFAHEHNEKIIEKIMIPSIWEYSNHLILYHNSIYQLNIIPTSDTRNNSTNKYRSLYDIINKTSTSMGKRLLKSRIMNPITNIDTLNNRYEKIDKMLSIVNEVELILNEIIDIERLHRKISLGMLHPYEFLNLTNSYENIMKLFKLLMNNYDNIGSLFGIDKIIKMNLFNEYIELYNSTFDLIEIGKYGLANINASFFKKGIYKEVDEIQNEIDNINLYYTDECRKLSNIIEENSDVVKLDFNEREGYFYYCTKKRADLLMERLSSKEKKEYEIKKFNGSNVKIVSSSILEKSEKLINNRENIQKIVKEKYLDFLKRIDEKYSHILSNVTEIIAEIDFIKAGAKTAIIYEYTRPNILDRYNGESYFSTNQIRHPIIEVINQERTYVGNDIELSLSDDSPTGILLYGVNGVGKSSLGKAIGTNIILAQMGFYTASNKFEYYPYNKIFTRINGDDNIFKGMSSFVVEMSELKSILKYADNRSIVIGDEVCKGTEETSALSIVSSSIVNFCKKNVNFIFATHFHKLYELSCIKSLNKLKMFHLSVTYDTTNDNIIYGRKLEEGPGSDLYGLEIANYIIKDDEFIKDAKKVRNEVLGLNSKLITDNVSNYNSKLIVDKCVICGDNGNEYPLDTHHIIEQNTFDDSKYTSFHKNKLSNLVILCKKHHDSVHHGELEIKGYKDTTNGLILDYDEKKDSPKSSHKKYNKMQISIIKDIYEKYKENKQVLTVVKNELKNSGINIAIKTIKSIVDGTY